MTTENKTTDLTTVVERAAWERPAMVRMDAADAEFGFAGSIDFFGRQPMGS